MNISSFREFIISVPTCHETDSLTRVWDLFQQTGAEQLVVVNQRQLPLGILKLCRFISVFSFAASLQAVPSQFQQDTLMAHYALLEPVQSFWEEGDFSQLQPHLIELTQQIVLVNTAGQYVGLLDSLRALQHLAAGVEQFHFRSRPACSAPASDSAFPDPLIDLLERLPLPLMLQTFSGRLITQNLAWRQQVGAIQNPQRIRRAAARVLEATLACRTDAKPHQSTSAEAQTGAKRAAVAAMGDRAKTLVSPMRSTTPSGVCHLGTEPNACVCVCPVKNGQDRVWQFIKVPMGGATAPQPLKDWDTALSFGETAVTLPFKLASLKFNPDPDWQSLLQTETLWLVLAQDITEQQQVAKELAARNADLVQLNRLKDEFLACISHELKTPLTAVLGMSSLLKDQLLGELNQRQAHYAQLIYRSGRHLIAVVNNILDLTRTETGQLELLLEQIHLPTLCQQVYEQAQQQQLVESETSSEASTDLDLRFQLEIQPEVEYLVADELRLRQMLTNLLSNAIKFTEPGGEVGLQVEAWEGWITFTIWDTGIGIPAEKQHLIFQKFQQLEHPLTRQFRGTGLGLVLTQRLAHLHGGDISFTSTAGEGSQFTLLLPPVPPQATEVDFGSDPACLQRLTPAADRNRLVLLVEADADYLEDRVEQLTELGYRTIIARSGTEAIEKARRLQPAAILLNPLLPLLSGWDVLTLLKADDSTRNLPIVMTAVRVEREQAYQNGADGFLSLPVELEGLKRCLERLITPVQPNSPHAIADLTVLHLYEGSPSLTLIATSQMHQDFQTSLYPAHCRVLEVDDLEQADLLARVWKPDVVMIDRITTDPELFVQRLSQAKFLAGLPLITLTAELTHAANQIPGLSIFPYLAMIAAENKQIPQPDMTELGQVIQLAAGMNWVPHILVMDCAAIELSHASSTLIRPPVRALTQYLQTAGLSTTVSNDWHKVQQKLQHQSIDLLLLCVSFTEAPAVVAKLVQTLQQLPQCPTVLVWNYQIQPDIHPSTLETTAAQWNAIATQILPASLSISELLGQINQMLTEIRLAS